MAAISGGSCQKVEPVTTEPTYAQIEEFESQGYVYNPRLDLATQIQLSLEMIKDISGDASTEIVRAAEEGLSKDSFGTLEHLGALQSAIEEANAQLWIADFENQQTTDALVKAHDLIPKYKILNIEILLLFAF